MTDPKHRRCQTCGAELSQDAAEGLCVACLLRQAALETEHFEIAGQTGSNPAVKENAPTLEAVAAAFPQLEILELVGQGGMGTVFKARQPKLNRFVALKILSGKFARDGRFADRFLREAQLLARLSHPNIVTVHDFGQSGGFYYLLMEFVDGVNLRQAIRAERFTPDQTLSIVPKICEALQYAHEEGVLHRDIKPENILLDVKGRVKIADFGIAKLTSSEQTPPEPPLSERNLSDRNLSEHEASASVTGTGMVLGTPNYMAPEQIERPSEVDHRADIYSLGVVFYELLTGELPLGRFAPPSEKSGVAENVDQIVLKALEKERTRRQQSAEQLKTEIETATSDTSKSRLPDAPPCDDATPPPSSAALRLGLLEIDASRGNPPGGRIPLWTLFLWPLCFLLGAVLFRLGLHDYPYEFYRLKGMEAAYRTAQIHGGVLAAILTLIPALLLAVWTYRRYRGLTPSPRRLALRGFGLLLGGILFFAGNYAGMMATQLSFAPYEHQQAVLHVEKQTQSLIELSEMEFAFDRANDQAMAEYEAMEKSYLKELRQAHSEADQSALEEHAAKLKAAEAAMRAKREEQQSELAAKEREREQLWRTPLRSDPGVQLAWKGFYFVLVSTVVVSCLLILAGAVCAWLHVARVRRQETRPGLVLALVTALIPTLPLLGVAPFLLIFLPFADMQGGDAVKVARSVAFVVGALTGIATIALFLRWLSSLMSRTRSAAELPDAPREDTHKPDEAPAPPYKESAALRRGLQVTVAICIVAMMLFFSRSPQNDPEPRRINSSSLISQREHALHDEEVKLVEEKRAIKQDAVEKGLDDAEVARLLEESDRRHEKRVKELEKLYDDTIGQVKEQSGQATVQAPRASPRLSLTLVVLLLLGFAVSRIGLRRLREVRRTGQGDGLISGVLLALFFPIMFIYLGAFNLGYEMAPMLFRPNFPEVAELCGVYGSVFGLAFGLVASAVLIWQTVRWALRWPNSPARWAWWAGGLAFSAAAVFLLSFSMYGTLNAKNNMVAHDADWQITVDAMQIWQDLRGKRFNETAALNYEAEQSGMDENERERRQAEIERKYDRLEEESKEQSERKRSEISRTKNGGLSRIRILTAGGFMLALLLAFAAVSCWVVYRAKRSKELGPKLRSQTDERMPGFEGEPNEVSVSQSATAAPQPPSSAALHSGLFGGMLLVLAFVVLVASMAGAVASPLLWTQHRGPIREAQKELRRLECRQEFWRQRLDDDRRQLAPAKLDGKVDAEILDEYSALYHGHLARLAEIADALPEKLRLQQYEVNNLQGREESIDGTNTLFQHLFRTDGQYYFERQANLILLGALFSAAVALGFLFRWRNEARKAGSLFAGLIAVLSSSLLLVVPVVDCWFLATARLQPNFMGLIFDLDGFWAVFLLAGLACYVLTVYALFVSFFGKSSVDAGGAVRHTVGRSRAGFALLLVLLPGLFVPAGVWLFDKTPGVNYIWQVEPEVSRTDGVEYGKMTGVFTDDYLALLKKHDIALTRDSVPRQRSWTDRREENPKQVFLDLLAVLSYLEERYDGRYANSVRDWRPVERFMAGPDMIRAFYVATAILLTLPLGLAFAVCHFVRLPDATRRRGVVCGVLALFFWPLLITLASAVLFPLAMRELWNTASFDDSFVFFFIALFGVLFHVAAIWWVRRRLRRSAKRGDV